MLGILEIGSVAEQRMHGASGVKRVVEDEVADSIRVERRVVSEPVASCRPAQHVDAPGAGAFSDPVHDRRDVADDLVRMHHGRVGFGRIRHFGRACGAAISPRVHDERRMSGGGEVLGERASGHFQVERRDAGNPGSVQENQRRALRRRRPSPDLPDVEADSRVAGDHVVGSHDLRRGRRIRERKRGDQNETGRAHAANLPGACDRNPRGSRR
jgi:hypothetical protein